MAFEDRSSPNTATSEGGGSGNFNSPNSPESTRTSPYTCMTISNSAQVVPKMEHPERSFFRITSFALPSPKRESDSPMSYRTPSPASSMSPPPEVIQPIKYSIWNILQPDFGKSAVLKTKSRQPNKAIGFRPYETEHKKSALGSLCQAVSQIGTTATTPTTVPKLSSSSPSSPSSSSKSPSLLSPKEVKKDEGNVPNLWPAWIYCTRYSDRPSSGPRSRRMKKPNAAPTKSEDKRPRTAFSSAQLARLKTEFTESRYLNESRRQKLSAELGLNEAQIKIWFQNKRAKIKKSSGEKNPLALQLMAQGLYNHSTVACDEDDMPLMG